MRNFFRPLVFLFCVVLACGNAGATIPETIDVGIFTDERATRYSFTPVAGRYMVCDIAHDKLLDLIPFQSIIIEKHSKGFRILLRDSTIFSGKSITIQGGAFHNSFLLVPLDTRTDARIYDGELNVQAPAGQDWSFINRLPFEDYIAATIQSESGFQRHPEFYKVQAIAIRTYALNNLHRHSRNGFQLCDRVHCQAYYGKTINPDILAAVHDTRGQVLLDAHSRLVNAVYHANCGGETLNSEDLWPHAEPYLRSRKDTFCISMPGATWEKTISMKDLQHFLATRYHKKISISEVNHIARIRQQESRIHHLDKEKRIHLKSIRHYFGLRSTFFSVEQYNDSLLLTGRGYGHGVGMCQEGAMKRAQYGHNKEEILLFYYPGTRIITLEPEEVLAFGKR